MKKTRWIIIGLLLLSISIIAMNPDDEGTKTEIGGAVPSFSATEIDGESITIQSLRGKVVVLNFFATWCVPCIEEMPHLEEMHKKLSSDEFMLLSVGREHSAEEVREFQKQKGLSFAMAPDPDRKIYGLFADKYIPRTYVIGKDGTILFQTVGFDHHEFEHMVEAIEKELGK